MGWVKRCTLKGATGDSGPGYSSATASVDSSVGTPSVTVTESGSGQDKQLSFAFHNLKGEQGEQGETGAQGPGFTSASASVDDSTGTPHVQLTTVGSSSSSSKSLIFQFTGLKGEQGEQATTEESFLAAHPVGSVVCMCDEWLNPGNTYGGTWEELPSLGGFMWKRTA